MKLLVLLAAVLALFSAWGAHAAAPPNVGFQQLTIADGDDKPLTIGVWYPTDAPATAQRLGTFSQTVAPGAPASGRRLPLVVMSHGTGGWYGGHYDTALALAHAGFVVAAVSHTGDIYSDHGRAVQIWIRTEHVHRLIDYMLATWPDHARIDARRIGVFGFSAGGFTALAASGGVPDLTKVKPHCAVMPTAFECGMIGPVSAEDYNRALAPPSAYIHDSRIRAAVVAAPALGFSFGKEGLKSVTMPVQLWRAEFDHVLPHPGYAQAVNDALPRPPEYHVVPGADHYDFLAPCDEDLAKRVPDICVSRPGFDRAAFHADFDAKVVAFFRKTLK